MPPSVPPKFFSKIGWEQLYEIETMDPDRKKRFERVYDFFRGRTFEEDTDLLGTGLKESESLGFKALKNHLCHTYMSFVLSDLPDEEIVKYLIGGPALCSTARN